MVDVKTEKIKSRWARSYFSTSYNQQHQEKHICDICQKEYTCPSSLDLHKKTHIIERPHKCDSCGVSYNSQNQLQKHIRSSAHNSRLAVTKEYGIPSNDNPRPYACHECNTGFRKHGHLSKHLRSKAHITRLEQIGYIPVGTYAFFEKSGPEIKDMLNSTSCEQSLISLRDVALHYANYEKIEVD